MYSKLIVLGLLSMLVSACGKGGNYSESTESYTEAEDSASIAVWEPIENQHDTLPHSSFYDSVLSYVKQATAVEREKRQASALLVDQSPLSLDRLASATSRQAALRSIDAYLNAMQNANDDLDAVYSGFYGFLKREMDSLYRKDTSGKFEALQQIARKDVLAPPWRPKLDSIEFSIASATRSLVSLLDTNRSGVDVSEGLRFRDEALARSYDSLRNALTIMSAEEAKVIREGRSSTNASGNIPPPQTKDTVDRPF